MLTSKSLIGIIFLLCLISKVEAGLAKGLVDVQTLTMFEYSGKQIYLYSMVADVNETECRKWKFYYIPVMQPIQRSNGDWVWLHNREIRVRLVIGDGFVETAARKAIEKKFTDSFLRNCSKFWDVSPLIIDYFIASIVKSSSSPVEGVTPFQMVNPNMMAITFRFECRTKEIAEEVRQNMIDGYNEIEIAFHFDGFKKVRTNFVSISGERFQSVVSKTIADGDNANARFIHRNQAKQFVNFYSANVKKMVYLEDSQQDISFLTAGLAEQFNALFQQGIQSSQEVKLKLEEYNKIWQSIEINPDRLSYDLNRVFILNETVTKSRGNKEKYYNVNHQAAADLIQTGSSILKTAWKLLVGASIFDENSTNIEGKKLPEKVMSASEIEQFLGQQAIEVKCTGQSLNPIGLFVLKLNDIIDRMQVAVIGKQMIAEKNQGAVIRTISVLDEPSISKVIPIQRQFQIQLNQNSKPSEDSMRCNCTPIIPPSLKSSP